MNLINQNINLNNYKIFYVVAKFKSFSKASMELHVSQPSISYSIKQLESDLNTKLFFRDKRKIILTRDGEKVLSYVTKMLQTINLGEQELNKINTISIGSPVHITNHYVIPLLKDYLKKKNINVKFESGNIDTLITKLLSYELDFIIDTCPKNEISNIEYFTLKQVNKCLIYNTNKFTFDKEISLKKLEDYTLILPLKTNPYRKDLDNLLQKNKIKIKSTIEVTNSSLMYKLMDEGVGIGFMIEDFIENKDIYKVIKIKEKLPPSTIDLIYLKNQTTMIKKMIKYIKERSQNETK